MKDYLLSIDNGNSSLKYKLYSASDFKTLSQGYPLSKCIEENNLSAKNTNVIIANVNSDINELKNFSCLDVKTFFKNNKFLDMPVNYTETIGVDRLVSCYYIFKKLPLKLPCLVIDAGTFLTCDLLSSKGFEGGYILPGIQTMLKSYQNGKQLPVMKLKTAFNKVKSNQNQFENLPHSTEEAILNGVFNMYTQFFNRFKEQQNLKNVIITGGEASYIQTLFNGEIIDDLNLKSLLFIYQQVGLK